MTTTQVHADTRGRAGGSRGASGSLRSSTFCCNWCSYAGADLAGVIQAADADELPGHPDHVLGAGRPGVRPPGLRQGRRRRPGARLPSGRLPLHRRQLPDQEKDRSAEDAAGAIRASTRTGLRLEWVSASEGPKFQKTIKDFTEKIRELGPNPLKDRERPHRGERIRVLGGM